MTPSSARPHTASATLARRRRCHSRSPIAPANANTAAPPPDSAYQLTHNALFPHDCSHVENLGGDIWRPELHNKRITLGVFPWKFAGGEAAFCRAVAWAD